MEDPEMRLGFRFAYPKMGGEVSRTWLEAGMRGACGAKDGWRGVSHRAGTGGFVEAPEMRLGSNVAFRVSL